MSDTTNSSCNYELCGKGLDFTPAMQAAVIDSASKLNRYGVSSVRVSVLKAPRGQDILVRCIDNRGRRFVVSARGVTDFYGALPALFDKVERKFRQNKEKEIRIHKMGEKPAEAVEEGEEEKNMVEELHDKEIRDAEVLSHISQIVTDNCVNLIQSYYGDDTRKILKSVLNTKESIDDLNRAVVFVQNILPDAMRERYGSEESDNVDDYVDAVYDMLYIPEFELMLDDICMDAILDCKAVSGGHEWRKG